MPATEYAAVIFVGIQVFSGNPLYCDDLSMYLFVRIHGESQWQSSIKRCTYARKNKARVRLLISSMLICHTLHESLGNVQIYSSTASCALARCSTERHQRSYYHLGFVHSIDSTISYRCAFVPDNTYNFIYIVGINCVTLLGALKLLCCTK